MFNISLCKSAHACSILEKVEGTAYRALELADVSPHGFSDHPDNRTTFLSRLGVHLETLEPTHLSLKRGQPLSTWAYSGGSVVKNTPGNAGDLGSISGPGRYPREGNGNPLQYSCLGGPVIRGAWQATVCAVLCLVAQLCLTLFDPMDCSC